MLESLTSLSFSCTGAHERGLLVFAKVSGFASCSWITEVRLVDVTLLLSFPVSGAVELLTLDHHFSSVICRLSIDATSEACILCQILDEGVELSTSRFLFLLTDEVLFALMSSCRKVSNMFHNLSAASSAA